MKRFWMILSSILLTCGAAKAQTPRLDLIPKPVSVVMGQGVFAITKDTPVMIGGRVNGSNANYIAERLEHLTGYPLRVLLVDNAPAGAIQLRVNDKMKGLPAEGYTLTVNADGVKIEAPTVQGVMNGAQTLFQVLSAKEVTKNQVPYLQVSDYPRFAWRGMMLDVSRQFFDKSFVESYIDWLAAHKMNIFHWHLTDDNGWRMEIKAYPDLTRKGGFRGPGEVLEPAYGSGDKRYGGYFTQDEMREMVSYAKARGIDIIPEIEIPGHSRAVVACYPQVGCNTNDNSKSAQGEVNNVWCVGKESNFKMLEQIIKEMTTIFPFEYIHVAGDEVNTSIWKNCPDCQALMKREGFTDLMQIQGYFMRRVEKIIEKYGKKMAGWNEIIKEGELSPQTMVYAWQGINYGIEAAKRGYPTIMMPAQYTYLDMAHTPAERGHRWAAIISIERVYSLNPIPAESLTEEQQKQIKGVQGGLWSEYLDRPARFAEYQSYPRLAALAEVGWTAQSERQWADFYDRLTRSHLARLSDLGIAFRDFPPTASYKNGVITVTPPYAGAVVRYDDSGREPTLTSPLYTAPIATKAYENYRFRSFFNAVSASPTVGVQKEAVAAWSSSKKKIEITQDITADIDKSGIWYMSFAQQSGKAEDVKVSLYENGKIIDQQSVDKPVSASLKCRFGIQNYQLSNSYKVKVVMNNPTKTETTGVLHFNSSAYQEPVVQLTSSMTENEKFPLTNLTTYNTERYFRSADVCKSGDWVLFTFATPVSSSRIEVLTGVMGQPNYTVTDGHLEYSYDGVTFTKGDAFVYGNASIAPTQPVKAVKIAITGGNNEPIVSVQNLRINK